MIYLQEQPDVFSLNKKLEWGKRRKIHFGDLPKCSIYFRCWCSCYQVININFIAGPKSLAFLEDCDSRLKKNNADISKTFGFTLAHIRLNMINVCSEQSGRVHYRACYAFASFLI